MVKVEEDDVQCEPFSCSVVGKDVMIRGKALFSDSEKEMPKPIRGLMKLTCSEHPGCGVLVVGGPGCPFATEHDV